MLSQAALDTFYGLSSLDAQIRTDSCCKLIIYVSQNIDQIEKVNYVEKRLLNGLISSNEASRQGFSLALNHFWDIHKGDSIKRIEKLVNISKTTRSMKAREVKDCLLGRLFGLASLLRSRNFASEDKKTMNLLIETIFDLMLKKKFLITPCIRLLCLLSDMNSEEVSLKIENQISIFLGKGAKSLFASFENILHSINSPDILLISLKCLEFEDTQQWKYKEFIDTLGTDTHLTKFKQILFSKASDHTRESLIEVLINVFTNISKTFEEISYIEVVNKILFYNPVEKNSFEVLFFNLQISLKLLKLISTSSQNKDYSLRISKTYFLNGSFKVLFNSPGGSSQQVEAISNFSQGIKEILGNLDKDSSLQFFKSLFLRSLENNQWNITSGFGKIFLSKLFKVLVKLEKLSYHSVMKKVPKPQYTSVSCDLLPLLPPEEILKESLSLLNSNKSEVFALKQIFLAEEKIDKFAKDTTNSLKKRFDIKTKETLINLFNDHDYQDINVNLFEQGKKVHELFETVQNILLRLFCFLKEYQKEQEKSLLEELIDVCYEVNQARVSLQNDDSNKNKAILVIIDNLLSLLAQIPSARSLVNLSIKQILRLNHSLVVSCWNEAANLILSAACEEAKLVEEDADEDDSEIEIDKNEVDNETESQIDEEEATNYVKVIEETNGKVLEQPETDEAAAYDESLQKFVSLLLQTRANKKAAKKKLTLYNHEFRMRCIVLLQKTLSLSQLSTNENHKKFNLDAQLRILDSMINCINSKGNFNTNYSQEIFNRFESVFIEIKLKNLEDFPEKFVFGEDEKNSHNEVFDEYLKVLLSYHKGKYASKLNKVLKYSISPILKVSGDSKKLKLFTENHFKGLLQKNSKFSVLSLIGNDTGDDKNLLIDQFIKDFIVFLQIRQPTTPQLANICSNLKNMTKMVTSTDSLSEVSLSLFNLFVELVLQHIKREEKKKGLSESQQLILFRQYLKLVEFNTNSEIPSTLFDFYSKQITQGRIQNPHFLHILEKICSSTTSKDKSSLLEAIKVRKKQKLERKQARKNKRQKVST